MTERKEVERPDTCRGCEFYKPDRGILRPHGWSRDGSTGHCMWEPVPVPRSADDIACRYGCKKGGRC